MWVYPSSFYTLIFFYSLLIAGTHGHNYKRKHLLTDTTLHGIPTHGYNYTQTKLHTDKPKHGQNYTDIPTHGHNYT